MHKKKLIIIAGPTASGKTKLALKAAKAIDGEIISGDSMQIYRELDVGTAKPTQEEMEQVPHHLINVVPMCGTFTAADFQRTATDAIEDIHSRNKIPILCGGAGLYIQSLLYGYQFSSADSDPAVREKLEREADEYGGAALYKRLQQVDPAAAESVHPNNIKRVVRMLEVNTVTGGSVSTQEETERESPYDYLICGLYQERKVLYDRINSRVDMMAASGLLEEAEKLYDACGPEAQASQAIGYKELFPYIRGEHELETCLLQLKQHTRRFAKRQLTWFRNKLPVTWFDLSGDREEREKAVIGEISRFIGPLR
ncbi:tRNA (adenosine(37)-N6)-dimethylallyltransferase MiaA [Alkalicoccus luteus]|uniref:tRNA dimethylallyltransferase n=1 Tax=Alkalicoccus luteus TaxID=1237094 RepID=A0A969TTR3_9BACI|nr:tRNA (adenosine(37)-N6)-dimethylallyltransferase MiaA [Alkalicoccus luteus]NJP36277.1 tRNA (adenosine(37)-N6)-dimethylallyltransferase MiaA [Alkalicoccus luteus]